MTDPLQTGLATGSETISHTRFDSVYIRLCTNSGALSSTLLCNCSLLYTPGYGAAPFYSSIYTLKVLKGGPLPSKLSDWAIPINAHLRSLNTCPGTLRTAHFPKTDKCARSPAAGLTKRLRLQSKVELKAQLSIWSRIYTGSNLV